jgi:hypothetical protein
MKPSRNPTVFIPQEPRRRDAETGEWRPLHDLTPALKFGIIEILMSHGPVMLDTQALVSNLKEKMKGFTAEDYILCLGDPSAIAVTVMVASKMTGGKVKLLKYDRIEKAYNSIRYEV